MSDRWTSLRVDELPAIKVAGDLRWKPVRRTLGIEAFGMNAYTGEKPGDDVVERRSEETRRYLFYFFAALTLSVALITVVIAQLSWRGWVQGLRALLHGEGILRPSSSSRAPELRPIERDVRARQARTRQT